MPLPTPEGQPPRWAVRATVRTAQAEFGVYIPHEATLEALAARVQALAARTQGAYPRVRALLQRLPAPLAAALQHLQPGRAQLLLGAPPHPALPQAEVRLLEGLQDGYLLLEGPVTDLLVVDLEAPQARVLELPAGQLGQALPALLWESAWAHAQPYTP